MPRKEIQYITRDRVFPIAYTRDGYAKANLNIFIRNADFLKFTYTFARHLAGINYISRLITPPVWAAYEVWRRKVGKTAPNSPEESLVVDSRIDRLIKAVASAVSDSSNPEEIAIKTMALNIALLRAMEDGTFHEISEKAGRVHAMAEIYHKYLRGELGDEELIANLGSIQLSALSRASPPSQPTEQNTGVVGGNNERRESNQPGEDGVFARLFASLMFSVTMTKRTEDH